MMPSAPDCPERSASARGVEGQSTVRARCAPPFDAAVARARAGSGQSGPCTGPGPLIAGLVVWTAMLLALAGTASAHSLSDGYVELRTRGDDVSGRIDLAARDLHDAIGIDDGDGRLRWSEIAAATPAIHAYLVERIQLSTPAGPCPLVPGDLAAVDRADGVHVAVTVRARCAGAAEPLTIDYRALFDVDATHRGLVRLDGEHGTAAAIARGPGPLTIDGGDGVGVFGFVREGVWHIWIGLDHILFLVALLLPAVYRKDDLRAALVDVAEIVTAFTLAHSITLIISTLGWVRLPSRFVETAIAVSVALAAANNLVRFIDARWAVAFALGLLHGFGFSSVLADLGLPGDGLVAALLGFNLGVEIGQAAIVLAFLPLAFASRRTAAYRVALVAGSAAICVLAVSWSIDRLTS
jgi:hypothetical protein